MTPTEIRKRVVSLVHGRDSKGGWIVSYRHDAHCGWCDRLTKFVEELLKEEDEIALNHLQKALEKELDEAYPKGSFKNPLAKDASLFCLLTHEERQERFRVGGLMCNCSTCKSHRVP